MATEKEKKSLIKFEVMKKWYNSFRERYPHITLQDALRASRNYAIGITKFLGNGSVTKYQQKRIDKMIKQLDKNKINENTIGYDIECNGLGDLFFYVTKERDRCIKFAQSSRKNTCIHLRKDGYCECQQDPDGNRIRVVLDEI